MAIRQNEQNAATWPSTKAGTFEPTLSPNQVFSIDFQQGFVAMISLRLTFRQSELWVGPRCVELRIQMECQTPGTGTDDRAGKHSRWSPRSASPAPMRAHSKQPSATNVASRPAFTKLLVALQLLLDFRTLST
jgi:hypothetical protein